MSELILYSNPMSRGRIARWALEETGEPYTYTKVEYGPDMKGPDYRAINPMGKVPALTHGDAVVTEVAAICAYLAETFPESNLAPRAEERAAYYRWLFFTAGPLEQAIVNASMGFEATQEQQGRVGYGTLQLTLETLNAWLSTHDYAAGARFTAADVYLGGASRVRPAVRHHSQNT